MSGTIEEWRAEVATAPPASLTRMHANLTLELHQAMDARDKARDTREYEERVVVVKAAHARRVDVEDEIHRRLYAGERAADVACGHVYPDGVRCTLTDHSAPGVAEVHADRLLAAEHDEPREQARAADGRHPHLERLRALSRAATPGLWEQERYRDGEMLPDGTGSMDDYETLGSGVVVWGEEIPGEPGERYATGFEARRPQDAAFIVAAVAYVRRLLGEPGGQDDS